MGIGNYGGSGINLGTRGVVSTGQNNGGSGSALSTNVVSLAAGAIMTIPAGPYMITPGAYSFIQFKDPITGEWRMHSQVGSNPTYVESDGANWRVANLTGCVVGGRLTTAGSGYTTVPTITFSAGSAAATAIMGQVVSTTATIVTGGANYTLPPLCIVSPPAAGGFPAKATATLTAGVVTAITITDQGAGYGNGPASVVASTANVPTITLIPNPEDANLNSSTNPITNATATLALDPNSAGTVTGVLVTNPGTVLTAVPTITFSSGSAAATAIMAFTVTAQTVSGGTGFGNTSLYTTAGGFLTAATAYVTTYNPLGIVRPAMGTATASSGVLASVALDDGGLFQSVPTGIVIGSALITASGTISAPTVGGVTDHILLQAV